MNRIRLIIKEEIKKFLEAIETDHYKLRKKQRLESEFTTFINENQPIKDLVFGGIEFLKRVNFPKEYNIGISMYSSAKNFEYSNKDAYSKGNTIWSVVRQNELKTIMFSNGDKKPTDINVDIKINDLKNYIRKNKNYNLTENDIAVLLNDESEITIKQNRYIQYKGVMWIADFKNKKLYQKNNSTVSKTLEEFLAMIPNELDKQKILKLFQF